MTNTFIPTLSRNPLYCVWIETGNPAHPLDRVWIDPELRSFVDVEIAAPIQATNDECDPEALAEALPPEGLFAGQLSILAVRREETKVKAGSVMKRLSWLVVVLCFLLNIAWADVAGRISGMVSDPSGAFVPGATVSLNNVGNGTKQTTTTNDQGQYSFPVVPIGHYELEVNSPGFQPYKKVGVVIDVNSALQVDAALQIGQNTQTVEVNDSVVTIQMSDTEIGETISSQHVAEVPLNGRSYTDLLATQAGVSPVTTSGAANSSSGGGFGTVPVAGNENTGQFSINGQRESANGFFLNGASVQESIGQQAGIIPNLDSIAEFRIISSNADAEYGGYSGGLINVVTKSGGDKFHGSAFEFLRNTDLDARGYFSPERSTFQQNQYGGTFGGPIKKSKIFFFGDYQGQRTVEGVETGIVSVPSLLNRTGNFSDSASSLTGKVNGASLAQTLSGGVGYQVNNGESFYAPGCTSNTQCVFPNAIIPQQAFGLPATKMLQFIPSPDVGSSQFSSGAEKRRTNDDKGSVRIDGDTTKYGTLSAYYFIDR
ncbi:MAG TPA: carboxypeptidase regulatory-like domain-containing protein, partial [Candidatus Acidoferrum sp.]|nr:carboxypeptidase regulatory-like domain-containing protein [Candidatus Acidoferrum sp.]